jgi:hypothetical protein
MPHGRAHHRLLRPATLALVAVAATLAAAGEAHGQALATATPNAAGGATRLHWAVDGTVEPVAGRIPSALTMTAPAGFALDLAAAPERCAPLRAKLDECPAKSRIGAALMTIRVFKPTGPDDLPVDIKLFRGAGDRVMAVAFLAGVRVVPGRLVAGDGLQLVFDPLPEPPVIPQVSYELRGITVDLGAGRRVVQRGARKGKGTRGGKSRRPRRTVRVDLVRTPPSCPAGGWAATATLAFPDGTSAVMEAPIACRG